MRNGNLIFKVLFSLVVSLFTLSSCVNKEYDLSNGVDTNITLLKNIPVPIGTLDPIKLESILNIDSESNNFIKKTESGDYSLLFECDEISQSFTVENMQLNEFQGVESEYVIKIPSELQGLDGTTFANNVIVGAIDNLEMPITFSENIPDGVTNIHKISFGTLTKPYSEVTFTFSCNTGKVNLQSGYTLNFPTCVKITHSNDSGEYVDIIDNHIIRIKDNVVVDSAHPYSIHVCMEELVVPDNAIVTSSNKRVMQVTDNVSLSGGLYANTTDFKSLPEEVVLEVRADIETLNIYSALVDFETNVTVQDQEIALSDFAFSELFDKATIDLYAPFIHLSIENNTDFTIDFHADLMSYKASQKIAEFEIGSENNKMNIRPLTTQSYYFSRKGNMTVPSGDVQFTTPELGEVFKTFPDKVKLSSIETHVKQENVLVSGGKTYSVSAACDFGAPLSFDKDFTMEMEYLISDMNINLFQKAKVYSAILSMDAMMTIPLDFELSAELLDADGNVLEDVEIEVMNTETGEAKLLAGKLGNPVTSPLEMKITSNSGILSFNSLNLHLRTNCPGQEHAGVPLNENQRLTFDNLSIRLPQGIEADLGALFGGGASVK